MPKVLISLLGTGRYIISDNGRKKQLGYDQCIYRFGDFYSKPTRLTARAISERFNIDTVFFIGTQKSIWDEVYNQYAHDTGEYDEEVHLSLIEGRENADVKTELCYEEFAVFESMRGKVEPVLVHYGIDQHELEINRHIMIELFNRIVKSRKQSESIELHIDITHGFRSLSFFIFNLLTYIREMLGDKIIIANVHYGMAEFGHELQKGDTEGGQYSIVPMLNLNEVYNITRMTQAAGELKKYGNGYLLSERVGGYDQELGKAILDFSNMINMQHIPQITSALPKFINLIHQKKSENHMLEIEIIQQVIGDFVKRFPQKTLDNPAMLLLELADWYYNNKRFGQAYVILYESLHIYVCQKCGLDPNKKEDSDKLTFEDTRNVMKEFYDEYERIRNIRNSSSHYIPGNRRVENYQESIKNLKDRIAKARKIIE